LKRFVQEGHIVVDPGQWTWSSLERPTISLRTVCVIISLKKKHRRLLQILDTRNVFTVGRQMFSFRKRRPYMVRDLVVMTTPQNPRSFHVNSYILACYKSSFTKLLEAGTNKIIYVNMTWN